MTMSSLPYHKIPHKYRNIRSTATKNQPIPLTKDNPINLPINYQYISLSSHLLYNHDDLIFQPSSHDQTSPEKYSNLKPIKKSADYGP